MGRQQITAKRFLEKELRRLQQNEQQFFKLVRIEMVEDATADADELSAA